MKYYGKKFTTPLLLAMTLVGISGCNTKIDREIPATAVVDAPKQIIAVDEAKGFYDDYSKRRVPLIQRYEDSINRARANDKMQQMRQQEDASKAQAEAEPAQFDVARYVLRLRHHQTIPGIHRTGKPNWPMWKSPPCGSIFQTIPTIPNLCIPDRIPLCFPLPLKRETRIIFSLSGNRREKRRPFCSTTLLDR